VSPPTSPVANARCLRSPIFDELRRAACWRQRANEAERLLAFALDHSAGDGIIRALLGDVEDLRKRVERAALGYPITEQDLVTFKWRRRFGEQFGYPLSSAESASLAVVEAQQVRGGATHGE
jgi:hypothetical protein